MSGPTSPFSQELHATKYRQEGESFSDAMVRIALALQDDDQHGWDFGEILNDMRFLPAGRVQAAIGSEKLVTPYNCFVSGTIADSFVEGEGSIMQRATEAAQTMRLGGGIGYDFSTLRPRGSEIKKLRSVTDGPLAFMEIFNSVCNCVASAGHRRGAQMGVLRIDHPDVEAFIDLKTNSHKMTSFNISLGVTDSFMRAVAEGGSFCLTFDGVVKKIIDARALWDRVMRTTYDWAEPGVLFIDRINEFNNLWYCEQLAATNPCGEQPLPPFGACLLGSFNLTRYVKRLTVGPGDFYFDLAQFREDIPPVVRAMDNVVDRALYPLREQEHEAKSKRRMGLGITGLANAAEALGYRYGSHSFLRFEREVLKSLRDETYRESAMLAREKGAFPLYDRGLYAAGKFIQTLPDDIRALIWDYGIRNSHLTSVAPTGTISLCADNVSSSIEPVYKYVVQREVNMPEGKRLVDVEDYGSRVFGVKGKRSRDVTAQEHVDVLTAAALLVDSAVSKTCNVRNNMPYDEFKAIYTNAWAGGAKGCTTFRTGSKRAGIFKEERDPDDAIENVPDGMTCEIDPATGRRNCE